MLGQRGVRFLAPFLAVFVSGCGFLGLDNIFPDDLFSVDFFSDEPPEVMPQIATPMVTIAGASEVDIIKALEEAFLNSPPNDEALSFKYSVTEIGSDFVVVSGVDYSLSSPVYEVSTRFDLGLSSWDEQSASDAPIEIVTSSVIPQNFGTSSEIILPLEDEWDHLKITGYFQFVQSKLDSTKLLLEVDPSAWSQAPVMSAEPMPAPSIPPPSIPPPPVAGPQEMSSPPVAQTEVPPVSKLIGQRVYAVQVGAFLKPGNAERISKKMAAKGLAPYIDSSTDKKGRQWRFVRIGHFAKRGQAEKEAATIKGMGIDAFVVLSDKGK